MPTKTVLISGTAGFLGWNIARTLQRAYPQIIGTWHQRKPDRAASGHCLQYDLEYGDAEALLAASAPSVLIHCAALASRAACEADPHLARRINVDATRRLAEACAERGTVMMFISTDLVFDGSSPPYRETDPPTPESVYAETKAEAEAAVTAVCPDSYILRISLSYGLSSDDTPSGFLSWNVGKPARGMPVQLYHDQYRTPLYAPDAAQAILALLEAAAPFGIYHCAGPERLSRFEIGMRIARQFDLREVLMQEASFGRQDDTSLSTEKIRSTTGIAFTSLDSGLSEIAQRIVL